MDARVFVLALLVLNVISNNILTYKFGKNFGQIFYDYSELGNHGQNGQNLDSDTADTKPTSRGAYFSNVNTTYIMLPPNMVKTDPIVLGPTFSLIMWFTSLEEGEYYLSYRIKDNSNYFYIKRENEDRTLKIEIELNGNPINLPDEKKEIFDKCI